MDLFLDTHVLIWLMRADQRLTPRVMTALSDNENQLLISAVTAFEFMDLRQRGRLPIAEDIETIAKEFECRMIDFPAPAQRISALLPDIHRDPIDRMLIAHAIVSGATLISADRMIAQYPVKRLW